MAPPEQVVQWLSHTYPKPSVDPDWLAECYSWIVSEQNLNPAEHLEQILHTIENQLLQSDLCDSMLAGTGLPPTASDLDNTTIRGPPILVEIVSMTEIGHSAFSLQNVRQARIERADLGGLAQEEDNDEEEGPVPNYPRAMLKFELSDGSTLMKAIEYRRIPQLSLGETPLGYKVSEARALSVFNPYIMTSSMLLKDVFVRKGIAFLEPSKVVLKGYQTEDREKMRDADFARGLRERLGLEDDPVEDAAEPPAPPPVVRVHPSRALPPARPQPPLRQPPPPRRTPSPPQPAQRPSARSPLQAIDAPPESDAAGPSRSLYADDEEQPRRRKVPASRRSPSPVPQPAGDQPMQSRYFLSPNAGGKGKGRAMDLSSELRLSPHRQGPVVVSDSEDDASAPPHRTPTFRGKTAPPVVVRPDPGVSTTNGHTEDPSSDFEYDFEFNDEVRAALDRVDQEVLAGVSRSATLVTGTSSSGSRAISLPAPTALMPSSSRTAVAVTAQLPINLRAVSRGRSGTPARAQATVHLGVIAVDDDESDEKENVPAPTRHVRRRVAPAASQPRPEDIIEISD